MKKSVILLVLSVIFLIPAVSVAEELNDHAKVYSSRHPFVAGEIIVKFNKPQSNVPFIGQTVNSNDGYISKRPKIKKVFGSHKVRSRSSGKPTAEDRIDEPGVYRLAVEGRDDIYSIIDELKKDPDVDYAEPNYLFQTAVTPNDPSYSSQWGYQTIGATAAWDVTKGDRGVVIAVIDTGVDYNHQDLAPNMWRNDDDVPGNGIDDDNNGYVDDVIGWDFVNIPPEWAAPGEDPGPPDNDPMDAHGHGTHVAGIAAGVPNNSLGIAGTAWNCCIMPLRAGYKYSDGSGYLELADIAEAIYYAADNGASVINMSFGSPYKTQLMGDAVSYAHSKGCVLVASAGNVDSYDAGKPFYPAAYDHVIAVSAVDREDKIAVWNYFVFSNFGDFVDLCAPGSSILSTMPGNLYAYANGTSMAAPFVSGVAALIKSKHKDWDADQIEARLKQTADNIYSVNPQSFLAGKLGAGRVNAKRALGNLSMAITYPKPSSIISGSVAIKGSANIEGFSGYKVEYSDASAPDDWIKIIDNKQPIEDGLLGVWSVSNTEGRYNLRLTVSNVSGESYEFISGVNFGLDGEVQLSGRPACGPSPFDPDKDQFLFYYDLLAAADVDIYVYDITGTCVWQRSLPYNAGTSGSGGSAGPNRIFWDGMDGFGQSLGSGAYVYMIVARDEGQRKIIGRGKFAVVRS